MAHDPINFVTSIDQVASVTRLARFIKRSMSTALKGRKVKRGEGTPSPATIIIIEEAAGYEVKNNVTTDGNGMAFTQAADMHAARAARDLNDDLAVLAAQNKAFKEGLLRLQALNLDEDLFIEAVQALRVKYYGRRNPIVSQYQSPQDAISDGETV